ncbi:MAG: S8 family serine peptidase [Deltaproteobacteria bacterium]|nr:S8 family serine peptidase [Deltaproteobacteria bacterium]
MKKHNFAYIWLSALALLVAAVVMGCDSGSSGFSGYTISGTITAPRNTAIDSDVNEINVIPVSNNYFDDGNAQSLQKNPVILGGYVNEAYNGEYGNSYLDGDLSDVFKITLTENETVNLYIADHNAADLNLYLYGQNPDVNNPIAESTGVSSSESLQAPSAGTYFIRVYAYSGASNYILAIGQGITGATIVDDRLQEDFMPGDIVVRFKPGMQAAFKRNLQSADDDILGLAYKTGAPEGEMVLKINADNRQRVFSALNIEPTENNRQLFQSNDSHRQLKLDTLRTIDALKKRPDVIAAEPNYMRYAMETPNDEYYPLQWHYPLIHLSQAWEITTGSADVIVAVIDTGILSHDTLLSHPDIDKTRLVDGYDFISDTTISADGDGIDENPYDPGDNIEGGRSSFHGTHVTGTIAAATNNATGVAGVARQCKIMPLRVLGNGGGLASDIRQAIYYAAGLDNSSGTKPQQRADIINMSLGGSSRSDLDQTAIEAARAAGVIIIAAAGNSATDTPFYPAAYNGVISVNAVGADKQLAPYSNFGPKIDIAAPGGNTSQDYDGDGHLDGVLSTSGDDASGPPIEMVYKFAQGTSMAAPHVAGVVALMKSVYDGLTPDLLDAWIADEVSHPLTEDLGPSGRDDDFGHGLIDALKAVITAQKTAGGEIPSFLFVSPLALNFGKSISILTLTAQNFGNEPLTDVAPMEDVPWLDIAGSYDEVKQIGTYTITVDRTGLAYGPYAATFTLESSWNTVDVSVRMQVDDPATGGDAGYHYVLLLDPDTFETIAQFDVAAPNRGVYPFSLKAPAGKYILFAGTDSDNDYNIGDPGESAGAYYSIDQPVVINLNQDLSGYNFTTSFNLNLPTSLSKDEDPQPYPIERKDTFQIEK